MKRREFIKSTAFALGTLITPGCLNSKTNNMYSDKLTKKPNVLFILTDDQRYDTIHALGNQQIRTPNIDKLVKNGVAFTSAYIMGSDCHAPCMPVRAMINSGRDLYGISPEGRKIPVEHETLGEVFKNACYQTYGVGKWHQDKASFARSFTGGGKIFFGGMSGHYEVPVMDYDPDGIYDDSKKYVVGDKHSTDLFTDEMVKLITEHGSPKPFMAYLAYTAPHDPKDVAPAYRNIYDPEKMKLPPNFMKKHPFDNGELEIRDELIAKLPRQEDEIRRHIADYYAMITHLDASIGVLIEALKRKGCYENTIIVFAGDNGLALGCHGLMGKQNLYEHSIKIPMIFCGPEIPKKQRIDSDCYIHDIYPTLCSLADIPVPDTVQGRSMLPTMKSCSTRAYESMYFAYRDVQRAIRVNDMKLIEYHVKGTRRIQLFNIRKDPFELHDLSGNKNCQSLIDDLRREMSKQRKLLGDNHSSYWTESKEEDYQ